MKVIEKNHIPITIQRRKVKNINLYVKAPNGDVLVTAPTRVPEQVILEFLDQKAEWIQKHRNAMIHRMQEGAQQDRLISEEQKKRLCQQIECFSQKWETVMNVHATAWQIRDMKTIWGSCSTKSGHIRINLQLAKKPQECIEYVIVHELCHLMEPSHNRRFHNLMDQYLPDWKDRKKRLNEITNDKISH